VSARSRRAESGDAAPRRISPSWAALGIVSLILVLAAFAPSPFVIEKPGPVVDALGSISTDAGDVDVVRISGAETYDAEGALNVLSVSVIGSPQDRVPWLPLLPALFDRTRAVVPLGELYPGGMSADEQEQQNAAYMRASQHEATAAALRRLGEPVDSVITVSAVAAGGPADGKLRTDDVIRTAGGRAVSDVVELRAAVAELAAAGPVPIGIERGGHPLEVSVAAAAPAGAGADADPMLGIAASTEFTFPFDVDLELDAIGGPSAGLVFALAITDELTPGSLTGGARVAGTGTIDAAGQVGAIGGLPQKIWGAAGAKSELMLIPLENCADVPGTLPDGMRIAPVANLDEAVRAIESVAEGAPVAGLERCGR